MFYFHMKSRQISQNLSSLAVLIGTLLFYLTGAHGQRTLQAPETMQWAIRQTEPPTGARPTVTSATANATSTGTNLYLYMATD